jgi:branched-chain amino acid transport system substrate-binding protein
MRPRRSAACPRIASMTVLTAVCAVLVAACSSSQPSGTTPHATSAATPARASSTPASTGALTASENDLAQRYVGGTPGKASGAPVTIGFANAQGGPLLSIPEATAAAQVAVEYINNVLGGVHGRPLQLKTCFIATSEEEGQTCGEEFADDPAVQVVTYPILGFGQQSMMAALRGKKPLISSAGQYTDPSDAYVLNGDLSHASLGGVVQYVLQDLKAKHVALVIQGDSPPDVESTGILKKYLTQGGATVSVATVQSSSPNVASALVSAGAQSADAIILSVSTPSLCLSFAEALPQLGLSNKPLVAGPTCVDPSIAKATGDMLKGTFIYTTSNVLAPSLDPDVQLYEQVMKHYAPSVAANLLTAPNAFSMIMTVAKLLNATKSMTAAEITKEVAGYTGPVFMAQPKTDCGFDPQNLSLCSKYTRAYTYEGNGKWVAQPWTVQSVIPWTGP